LLLAHEGCTDETIADRAGMHCRAIENLRQRFVEDGFEVSLEGKERGHRPRVLSGEDEARLAALECMDECPKQFFSFYFWGRCGGYPPQRGVGRNEVRPRGEASPHLITPAGKGT
jgi:hypothetical protein